jgi:hypothetical protein
LTSDGRGGRGGDGDGTLQPLDPSPTLPSRQPRGG